MPSQPVKSRSGTGIPARCTCGGRGGRWPRAGRCSSLRWSMIRIAIRTISSPTARVDEEAAGIKRADLFNLIEELVMWENSNNPQVIRTARAEIARCVASRLIETGVLKKETEIAASTAAGVPVLAGKGNSGDERPPKGGTPAGTPAVTAYDLVKRGHCRPIPTGLDKKVGRVRFSFDVSDLPPAEAVNAFLAEHAPPVLDPFCGGGSIPLEAQRLGLRAYASDLNPVPVLINKALIEIPPKFAGRPPVNPKSRNGLKSERREVSNRKNGRARRAWPRTFATTANGCATKPRSGSATCIPRSRSPRKWRRIVPILNPMSDRNSPSSLGSGPEPLRLPTRPPKAFTSRSFARVLSAKTGKQTYAWPVVDRTNNTYRFDVRTGATASDSDPRKGTVNRSGATCLFTNSPIPFDYIRKEGKAGRLANRLIAIVADGGHGRVYLPPLDEHRAVADVGYAPRLSRNRITDASARFST